MTDKTEKTNKTFEISEDAFSIQPPSLPDSSQGLEIEISDGKTKRSCAGECGGTGKWRLWTKTFVCPECRQKPPHKLITRTEAKNTYGLTFDDLHSAWKDKKIRMITTSNPHGRGLPPMHLYYEHEIQNLYRSIK